jgi:hypothetical protein
MIAKSLTNDVVAGADRNGMFVSGVGIFHFALQYLRQAPDHHLGGDHLLTDRTEASEKSQHIDTHAIKGQQLANAQLAADNK